MNFNALLGQLPQSAPTELPSWPSQGSDIAGVIDGVDDKGFHGWILNRAHPEQKFAFEIHLNGRVVGRGKTRLVRADIASAVGQHCTPGFFVPWRSIERPSPEELVNTIESQFSIFVPSLGASLARYGVGSLSLAELEPTLPRHWLPGERRRAKIEARSGPSQPGFYAVGLPRDGMVVASKRICFVTTELHGLFKNGGIGTANTGLATELAEAGWDVTVLFVDCDDNGPRTRAAPFVEVAATYKAIGITLEYLPRYSEIFEQFRDIRRVSYAIYRTLRDRDFSAIYFNECGGHGFYTIMAAKAGALPSNPKTVVVTHGPNDWTHELNSERWAHPQLVVLSYMEKKCVEHADFVISPSEYLLEWMRTRGWKLPPSLFVEQNIVSVKEQLSPVIAAGGGGSAISEIVFFGRQEPRKGVVLFCDALDRIVASGQSLSAVTITYLGKIGRVGAANSAAYITLRSAKWGAKVRFLARLGQIEANEYLRRPGRLAVIPSLAENSPCVVAECLQLGIPFIATDAGGTSELVAEQDRAQCLVPPHAAPLADRIVACLRAGQSASRMAVEQAITRRRWRNFMKVSGGLSRKVEAPTRGE